MKHEYIHKLPNIKFVYVVSCINVCMCVCFSKPLKPKECVQTGNERMKDSKLNNKVNLNRQNYRNIYEAIPKRCHIHYFAMKKENYELCLYDMFIIVFV